MDRRPADADAGGAAAPRAAPALLAVVLLVATFGIGSTACAEPGEGASSLSAESALARVQPPPPPAPDGKADDEASGWEFHSRFLETVAVELDGGRVQQAEFEARPSFSGTLPWGWQLVGLGRLRGDPVDRLEPGRPDQSTYAPESRRLLIGDSAEAELREFYLQRSVGRGFVVLGKQQVVWGKADGIKLLDVVDPQSYREFILADFSESRIPLWTVNVEHPIGPVTAQLLWIPDTTVHDFPEKGGVYEITSSQLVPTAPGSIPVVTEKARRPKDVFDDSDAGLRLSGHAGDVDLTLNYLYHYEDAPVLYRRLDFGPTGLQAVVTPRYERTHVIGTTFADSIGDWTLRGEAAVFTDRFVSNNAIFDNDGLEKGTEYSWLLGLDCFVLAPDTFLSAQLFQSLVPGLSSSAVRDELVTLTTLLARHTFADGAGLLQVQWLEDPGSGDGLVRTQLRYEFRSDVTATFGADFFYGSNSGIFGEFDGRDRFVFGLETGI